MRLFLDLAEGKEIKQIKADIAKDIQEMREIREDVRFGPSTGSLVEEAVSAIFRSFGLMTSRWFNSDTAFTRNAFRRRRRKIRHDRRRYRR